MFKNIRLRTRLLLGYGVPVVLAVGVAVAVYINVGQVENWMPEMQRTNAIMTQAYNLQADIFQLEAVNRGFLLVKDVRMIDRFSTTEKEIDQLLESLDKIVKVPDQKERLAKIETSVKEFLEGPRQTFSLINEGKLKEAIKNVNTIIAKDFTGQVEKMIQIFTERERSLLNERNTASLRSVELLYKILIGGIALTLLLSVTIGLWIISHTNRLVQQASQTILTSASEIAATVNQHEHSAVSQASMVNETTTTVVELNASSHQSAEQASTMAELSKKASTLTDEGNAVISQAVTGISGLREKVGTVADRILQLGEQTVQVGAIANLVRDLASQTNMLALNAAVEAARAGEHGKGFAVVAGEVRKLADLSKKSAEDANVIIADIQKATNSTIMVTEEGSKTADEVVAIANRVGELFHSLSSHANRVYENAQQVLLNSRQQSEAINQIGEAMKNIDLSANETAAGINQTKIGIQNLEQAAAGLRAIV